MQHLQLERTIGRVEAAAGTVCGQQLSIIVVLLKWHRTLKQHRILTAVFSKPCRMRHSALASLLPPCSLPTTSVPPLGMCLPLPRTTSHTSRPLSYSSVCPVSLRQVTAM